MMSFRLGKRSALAIDVLPLQVVHAPLGKDPADFARNLFSFKLYIVDLVL